ncbi:hypothetical protein CSTERTH_12820 [Thermoclostridium stercorarium subsp. thermolacticum DSM 2910]|uniref:Uncharacterized protein n=1 Tax=Thermoclostridium stercorarium subsp. thermolacticum DSM 2910 TaxID=1121336 RepID=A0A1B1YGI8_THEST|nr:hypothetical protein [Thermoclostridium stercorarium]ANW99850.1 hypothetical protein CSTERTH_12820 [Thermoclostridium stercorarium subsp. thermolacticum DSM 2910]
MAVVYFYVPAEKADDVIECGLKLSEWKDREQQTPWNPEPRACLCARLHPDDDKRSRDPRYRCIKINIPAEDCVVADGDLYRLSMKFPDLKQKYIGTMVPLNRYMFGSFRKPECLIFTTILGEQISIYGKGLDDPILYENSETLYVNNIIERYNDRYDGINQALLYCFLSAQSRNGVLENLTLDDSLAYFSTKDHNRYVTLSVPDLKKYVLDLI